MTTKPKRVRTLARFQKEITELKDVGEFVYRGQSNKKWTVTSAAYRRLSKGGKRKPSTNELIEYNKDLINNAKNYEQESRNKPNLELLAELQHYGAATSLIDFSYSALMALWFACQDSTKDGKVFCLNTVDVNAFLVITPKDKEGSIEDILKLDLRDNKNIKIAKWQPPLSSNRIIKQDSVFIFNQSGEIKDEDFNKVLIISKAHKVAILKDLEKLAGITETRIYPDFYGFAQSNASSKPYDAETAEEIFARAVDYHLAGRFKDAIANYDQAIELNPDYVVAYNNRGVAKAELKQFQKAIKDYDRAIELNPDFAMAYNNRGNTKVNLKQFKEAIADYNRAIELNPDFAMAYNDRGIAKAKLKRVEEAIADFDQVIELKSDFAEAYSNRANAKNGLKRFEEAIADCDRAIELKSDFAEAYSNRANAKADLRRFEEAIADYDRAIELKPDFAEIYTNRGIEKAKSGRIEEAIEDFERAKEIFSKQGRLKEANECQEAIDELKTHNQK